MLDHGPSIAIREESKVPDLHKSSGQHVQEESPDELDGIECHFFDLILVLRVAPAKVHPAVLQSQQTSVGNRHSVGVARQIL